MESSLMRSSAVPIFCRNPSWVCAKEMALPTLLLAALVRLMSAPRVMDSDKPAGSSAGEVIFEPEDKRASDLFSIEVEAARLLALVAADTFVLIIITNSFP